MLYEEILLFKFQSGTHEEMSRHRGLSFFFVRRGVALLLFCTKKFGQFDALLEYGVEKEGYWTGEKFMENVKDACKLMTISTQVMPTLFCGCLINQAARAFAEDALNVR